MGTQIGFHLKLVNAGLAALNLPDITVRYWFTADGNAASGLVFVCDYASNNNGQATITSDVTGTFLAAPAANVTATSDTYLELSFNAAAGMLASGLTGGGVPVEIQVRFYGNGFSDRFNESNDYSFDATKTMFQASSTITAYQNGRLVWGCEPGAAAGSSSGGG
jgi:cellulose binding protein with CBM3 domain